MFYCQHVLGIGHLVRSAEIAAALAARFDVRFVSGGTPVENFPFAPGIEVVQLPPLETGEDFDGLRSTDEVSVERTKELRKAKLLALFDEWRPDVLIVELFPFGRKSFSFELMPLLQAARANEGRTKVVCSLRDLLVRKEDRAEHEERVCRIVNAHFDLILVHGDPRLFTLADSFDRVRDIAPPIRYTGYVTQGDTGAQADAEPFILVSAGSGRCESGCRLIEAAIQGAGDGALRHCRYRVFAGPLVRDEDYARFAKLAEDRENVVLERYTPHLQALMRSAKLSVSMAGYNTLMNILSTGVRALVYPFTGNEDTEQTTRAMRLEELGLIGVLPPETPEPAGLAARMKFMLATTPAPVTLDLAGAANTLNYLLAATGEPDPVRDTSLAQRNPRLFSPLSGAV